MSAQGGCTAAPLRWREERRIETFLLSAANTLGAMEGIPVAGRKCPDDVKLACHLIQPAPCCSAWMCERDYEKSYEHKAVKIRGGII